MAQMSTPPLAQSAEKVVLLARLGCDSEADHKMMLSEAADGRDRLSCNPANLTPASRADPNVRQPYKWDQLSETAKHREILSIFARASSRTRQFYERAHYRTPVRQGEWIEENWAIRWYIWHSFRYRDNRDHRAARATQMATVNADQGQVSVGTQNLYWDAARGQWVHLPYGY